MSVSFDGKRIVNRPSIDRERYATWRERDLQEIRSNMDNDSSASHISASAIWKNWVIQCSIPRYYANATPSRMTYEHPHIATQLEHYAHVWADTHTPQHMFITAENGLVGRTWTAYAWVAYLISARVIDDPKRQVKFVTESVLMESFNDTRAKNELMANLYDNGNTRLIIYDGVNPARLKFKRETIESSGLIFINEYIKKWTHIGLVTIVSDYGVRVRNDNGTVVSLSPHISDTVSSPASGRTFGQTMGKVIESHAPQYMYYHVKNGILYENETTPANSYMQLLYYMSAKIEITQADSPHMSVE